MKNSHNFLIAIVSSNNLNQLNRPTLSKNRKMINFWTYALCRFRKIILKDEFKGTGTSLQLDVKFP